MSRNTSITLGPRFERFITEQLESGRYASTSEVIRAGLRLLEEHEDRVRALRAELDSGESSGPAEPLDIEAFLSSQHASHGSR